MKVRVKVVIECEGETPTMAEIGCIERSGLSPADLGLHLDEARGLLGRLQATMVEAQIAAFDRSARRCSDCGAPRSRNGRHKLVYRTVFGRLSLDSPRYYACRSCSPGARTSDGPLAKLLADRTSPELQYLQTKFAGLMSYGLAVDVLGELLPLDGAMAATSVRRCVASVGERLDQASEQVSGDAEADRRNRPLIPPAHPVQAIGIDGGYVKRAGKQGSRKGREDGWFEVMTAKTQRTDRPGKAMAYVHARAERPSRRFQHFLETEGVGPFDPVTIISDGGATVRQAQEQIRHDDELILDWFHVAMRIQNMAQVAKGLHAEQRGDILKDLDRTKWLLWHGCPDRAEHAISWLIGDVDALDGDKTAAKLLKMVEEFAVYIGNNSHAIVDYGERYRNGDPISSSFVESAINQVVSKRFVKKQQMAWSQGGAHALLQVRTAVLNDDLKAKFEAWYPAAA